MNAHSRRLSSHLTLTVRAACHALAPLLVVLACARTGLDPGDVTSSGGADFAGGTKASGGMSATGGVPGSGGALTTAGAPSHSGAPSVDGGTTQPTCTPSEETCNGRDDDCDGQVDEVPAEPCPGGGFSYCIAGRQSACPRRCDVCVPGSERVCLVSYCTFWGKEVCAADGRGFGSCREERVPDDCSAAARGTSLAKLEQCCLDRGDCCLDSEDLDHDGNRNEMLGNCEDVACE